MNTDTGIWVPDSSALIGVKTVVPGARQWGLFRRMESLVEEGRIAFPRHVRTEMQDLAHPDAPGVWAAGVFPAIKHAVDPDADYIRRVMASDAKAVVDPNKAREDADPFIIAQALQLMDAGYEVCVVTEDHLDNPTRIALTKACDICSVEWIRLDEFLKDIGFGA
jgi:hypothetical protein